MHPKLHFDYACPIYPKKNIMIFRFSNGKNKVHTKTDSVNNPSSSYGQLVDLMVVPVFKAN